MLLDGDLLSMRCGYHTQFNVFLKPVGLMIYGDFSHGILRYFKLTVQDKVDSSLLNKISLLVDYFSMREFSSFHELK